MPAGTRQASSPMLPAATHGRATTSATALRSGRSACASGSAIRPVRSSFAGLPTWAFSAARRTSTSPEAHGYVRAVGDQRRNPWVGEETGDTELVVDGPDPGRDATALAVTQDGQAGQLPVDRKEVGVAALQPVLREQLAQPHVHLQPR